MLRSSLFPVIGLQLKCTANRSCYLCPNDGQDCLGIELCIGDERRTTL